MRGADRSKGADQMIGLVAKGYLTAEVLFS
jgi:hypothetical protein